MTVSIFHLECRPVHMHVGAVVVAEPLQVLLCVCTQDRALQLSVCCGIAEERKVEQILTMKVPAETRGGGRGCQLGNRSHNGAPNLGWEGSNIGSWQNWSVSLSFLLKPSTDEVFGLIQPNNPWHGYMCSCSHTTLIWGHVHVVFWPYLRDEPYDWVSYKNTVTIYSSSDSLLYYSAQSTTWSTFFSNI